MFLSPCREYEENDKVKKETKYSYSKFANRKICLIKQSPGMALILGSCSPARKELSLLL